MYSVVLVVVPCLFVCPSVTIIIETVIDIITSNFFLSLVVPSFHFIKGKNQKFTTTCKVDYTDVTQLKLKK